MLDVLFVLVFVHVCAHVYILLRQKLLSFSLQSLFSYLIISVVPQTGGDTCRELCAS